MTVKTRFSPSPTGRLHLGNVRTSLISWLYARSQSGCYLVRIEDTDKERSTDEYAELLLADLKSLGIDWDEGPHVNADSANYYQSNRGHIYENYYRELAEKSFVYPCFCSPSSLELTRKRQLANGEPPRYVGTCASLTAQEIASKREQNQKEVLRFRVDKGSSIQFEDIVKGSQKFFGKDIGDFIIRKNDGTPTFMFCNAVDDALMGVTQVVRGEDHLTNTPRQILILRALALELPQYCHLSTILGNDGAPLSKRNGSASIRDMLEQGYHPLALCNYLARLGHVYESNDLLTVKGLIQQFTINNLGKSAARYDVQQLDFWQKKTIESLDTDSLARWLEQPLAPYVKHYPLSGLIAFVRSNIRFPSDAVAWLSMLDESYSYSNEALEVIRSMPQAFFDEVIAIIDSDEYTTAGWHVLTQGLQNRGYKGKGLFLPLRAALTGSVTGPALPDLVTLIGKAQTKNRFERAALLC